MLLYIESFSSELKKYMDVEREIRDIPSVHVIGCMCLDSSPLMESLISEAVQVGSGWLRDGGIRERSVGEAHAAGRCRAALSSGVALARAQLSPRVPRDAMQATSLVGRKAFQEQESVMSKAEYICNQAYNPLHLA